MREERADEANLDTPLLHTWSARDLGPVLEGGVGSGIAAGKTTMTAMATGAIAIATAAAVGALGAAAAALASTLEVPPLHPLPLRRLLRRRRQRQRPPPLLLLQRWLLRWSASSAASPARLTRQTRRA